MNFGAVELWESLENALKKHEAITQNEKALLQRYDIEWE